MPSAMLTRIQSGLAGSLHKAALPLLVLLLLSGCGGGAVAVRYYLIDPVDYPRVEGTPVPAVEILDIDVPQYLERFQIATRREPNQLHFSGTSQWGENLRKNLMRTLARNLSRLLATSDVSTPLNRSLGQADYRVQLHIEQFERDSDGIVRLLARWQLVGKDPAQPATSLQTALQYDARIAADDYDAIVAAMQSLFGRLSEQIAASIRAADNPAPAQASSP